jgi:DNA-directed RNA polymerase subunit RPC12/RpoP
MSALPTHDPVYRPGRNRPAAVHNGRETHSMPNLRPFPSGYATVQAIQELNARLDELSERIDAYFAAPLTASPEADAPPEVRPGKAAGLRCPQCNKRTFRKSRRETIGEKLSAFLLMRPFRCRYCAHFEFRSIFTRSVSPIVSD